MIASGEKKEEYRAIKLYWNTRFCKHYNVVLFRNGYSKNSPYVLVELLGIDTGYGKEEWGAPSDDYVFILSLGKIIIEKDIQVAREVFKNPKSSHWDKCEALMGMVERDLQDHSDY